jgi:hypothetical protein
MGYIKELAGHTWSAGRALPRPEVEFTIMFSRSYCTHRSQKRTKPVKPLVSLSAFWIFVKKAAHKTLVKLIPGLLCSHGLTGSLATIDENQRTV